MKKYLKKEDTDVRTPYMSPTRKKNKDSNLLCILKL